MEFENFVPLMKTSKGFEELKKTVIDQGICSGCSTCAAFCERIEIGKDGVPFLAKECNMKIGAVKCSSEGTCYDNCPMVSFSKSALEKDTFGANRQDEDLGYFKKIVSVRSKNSDVMAKAQGGGAATSLLAAALDAKLADGAVVAKGSESWSTEAIIARNLKELVGSAGTKYTRTPTIRKFGKSMRDVRKLAVVGTGCQTMGARRAMNSLLKTAIRKTKDSTTPLNLTLIGLFCFENFPYDGLKTVLEREYKIKMEDIAKTDITKGKFIVTTKDGQRIEKSVKTFAECVPHSCELCTNFTAEMADISVGSVGSESGWSTVIVRSDKGMALLENAEKLGYIEIKEQIDLSQIKKNVSLKKEKRKAAKEMRSKEGKFVPEYD